MLLALAAPSASLILAAAPAAAVSVAGRIIDENGVAVKGARFEATSAAGTFTATADDAGDFKVQLPAAGEYQVHAQQSGFFVYSGRAVLFQEGANELNITLNHLQELTEKVDVSYSPPAIDPQQTEEQKDLNSVEILEIPYPASQDYRSALPMMPGVVQDASGALHFNGGASDQTNFTMDGFNLSDPYTGQLGVRVSVESVRSLDLESGRYSAEKGQGSSGSLDIKTAMGDDRWRFATTNFIPGVSTQDGIFINKWTPRVEVSGPLAKGRAWFHNGFDTFYDINVISGLPHGENRSRSVTTSNMSRFQVNLTPANILTGSFLLNYGDDNNKGLTILDPVPTTTNDRQHLYVSTVRDQWYLGGAVVEVGFADSRGLVRESPQGDQIYEILPFGHRGNFFLDATRRYSRQQWLANAFLPPVHWLGNHQFKLGVDLEHPKFDRLVDRHNYEVVRNDMSVARLVSFAGNRVQGRENFQGAQYVQDRWSPREGLMIEAGIRAEWDEIVRDVLWSPRLSAAYAPKWLKETKLSAGFGVFYDALTLATLTQQQDQVSLSTFFLPNGTVRGPVETSFAINERALRVPRYRTASFGVERKLPWNFFGKAGYTHRVGSGGFTFVNELETFGAPFAGARYLLHNWRHDQYDAAEISVRRLFGGRFEWVAGYVRSRAQTDAVVAYSLENPIFAPQGPGRVAWDTPNRFLTWGWAPVPKARLPHFLIGVIGEMDVVYLLEYRTGFPFSVVNEDGYMVGTPDSRRFPNYFNINLALERKFRFFHYLWAWRFGFNNLTNNGNPNVVNNNIDSPMFLMYGRGQVRAFAVRLRFLGRK